MNATFTSLGILLAYEQGMADASSERLTPQQAAVLKAAREVCEAEEALERARRVRARGSFRPVLERLMAARAALRVADRELKKSEGQQEAVK